MKNKFIEDDEKKVVEFLNFIAQHAKFENMNTKQAIEYVKLLNHIQVQILPKIKDNIFEIKKVTQAKEDDF